jgi:hypothetical protein
LFHVSSTAMIAVSHGSYVLLNLDVDSEAAGEATEA